MMPSFTSLRKLLKSWRCPKKEKVESDVIDKVKGLGYISYEGEIIINTVLFFNQSFIFCPDKIHI